VVDVALPRVQACPLRAKPVQLLEQPDLLGQLECELADKTGILSDIFIWIETHHPDGFIDGDGFVEQLDKIMDRYHEKRESLERELEVLKSAKIPAMVSEKDRLILTQELAEAKARVQELEGGRSPWIDSDECPNEIVNTIMDLVGYYTADVANGNCGTVVVRVEAVVALEKEARQDRDQWRECARRLNYLVRAKGLCPLWARNEILTAFDRLEKEIQ
jgi:hypothetical protein